ncbi:hypothetical protein ABZT26_36155 [Streptomyces sp. NPDC005395]|uniref:hypothetical protein n=1 Tax=Streptomyces sp. NPDC005395 TaxID=3157042 RepID=UPI0033A0D866
MDVIETVAAAGHDAAACLDLDCEVCWPEYVPAVGDYVRDARNVWLVTSTCTERGGFIELKHTVYGHYADQPRKPNGAFMFGAFEKTVRPA